MATKLEIIQHITNLLMISSMPTRSRTDKQEKIYYDSIEFVRSNMIEVYSEYYSKFEQEFAKCDIATERVMAVIDATASVFDGSLVPDRYKLVDAINRIRGAMSSVSGLSEELVIALDYYEGELERLEKIFTLFINTDKGWMANAFAQVLRNDSINNKMTKLKKNVDLLNIRYDALDKEFRALSRMLGALMDHDSLSERPRVIHDRAGMPFSDIVEK